MPTIKKAPAGIPEGFSCRSALDFKPSTLREDDRSVEFVLTTEEPARVWSWERMDVVEEVLVAKGMVLPANNQVPLQDSHNRGSIKNTLGSVREIRIENDQVVGRLYFARSAEAIDAFEKIKDGHVDSGSVGYNATGVWIDRGKSYEHEGVKYDGPLQLTTKWDLKEYSITAIGADPFAKARSEAVDSTGIDTKTEDECNIEKEDENISDEINNKEIINMPTKKDENVVIAPAIDVEAVTRAAIEAEKARVTSITSLCAKHDLQGLVADFITNDTTVERAQATILDKIAERQAKPIATANTNIEMGADETDKFRAAATDGMLMRAGLRVDSPAAGSESCQKFTFKSLARECLRRAGRTDIFTLTDSEALGLAMKSGTMSTSDFSHILDAASNKAVSKGFQSAQQSWKLWANKGSLTNLESANRVNLDDAPELLETDQGEEIKQGIIGDRGEAIQLSTLARKITITRRALLADDMNLFSRLFAKFGARAAAMIEAAAYSVLTTNANMGDGSALFLNTAARGYNLAATAAVVSATSVDQGYQKMMAQSIGTDGIKLGIVPRFLLVGPKNRVAGHILTTSMQDTTLTSNANGASNAFSDLQTIASPHLGNDWYMAASPMANDTVEVAFLDGKETPTIYPLENQGDILGKTFVAFLDIGASAIGYQGLFKNAGV